MRKTPWALFLLLFLFRLHNSFAQGEPFSLTIINTKPAGTGQDYRLAHPYEIIYGPDDHLYISEKIGRIIRVNPITGIRQIILDHTSDTYVTISRNGSGDATSIGQDGMMGIALHPGFGNGTGHDSIFVAYSYAPGNVRISRFRYNGGASPSLTNETVLIEGIPSSNDHSSGRLIVGEDELLYYTCGDMGNNQFGNRCSEIRSQKLPSSSDISSENYARYSGKILRLNRDGSIPSGNPLWAGVRSHIFTIGHRNPQGLVWQKNPTDGTAYPTSVNGGKLFSSEHGPRTDDEINVIEGGKNYGWPYIAGYLDNINYEYIIWCTSSQCSSTGYTENTVPPGALIRQESDTTITNFQPPFSTLYTECTPLPVSTCDAGGTNWMKFPTVAPSSVDFYNVSSGTGIPNWYPSILVPTLRRGVVYRYKLDASINSFVTDSIPYFRTSNRYRDIALSRDGLKIYLVTDSIGTTSGPSGSGTTSLANPGAIMEYYYINSILPLGENPPTTKNLRKYNISVYPNPATASITISFTDGIFVRPTRYQLFDMAGKLITGGVSNVKQFQIDISRIQKGIYVLKLFNGYNLELGTEKILIQ